MSQRILPYQFRGIHRVPPLKSVYVPVTRKNLCEGEGEGKDRIVLVKTALVLTVEKNTNTQLKTLLFM